MKQSFGFIKKIFYVSALVLAHAFFLQPQHALSQSILSNYYYAPIFLEKSVNFTEEPAALSLEEIKSAAINALKAGLPITALSYFNELEKNEKNEDLFLYGKALSLAQQGKFDRAQQIASSLFIKENSRYQQPAADLRGTLLLYQAEIALQSGKTEQATTFLQQFFNQHPDHDGQDHANRVLQALKAQQYGQQGYTQNANKPLRVGLLVPLSGDFEAIGLDMLRAAQNALFDHSHENFLLYPEDTQGTPEGAEKAFQQLLQQRVDIILGPVSASETDAILPFSHAQGIPVISFSSDTSLANNNIFLMSFNPAEQARYIARRAVEDGKTSFSALVPNTTYGHEVLAAFSDELQRLGADLISHEFFNLDAADLTEPLRTLVHIEESEKNLKIELSALEKEYRLLAGAMSDVSLSRLMELREAKPEPIIEFDALFIPAPAKQMPLIASQLAFFDIDTHGVTLLGTALWHDKKILKNRAEYLRGSLFPAPSSKKYAAFEKNFGDTYGGLPHPLARLAYDAIELTSHLHKIDAFYSSRNLRKQLLRKEGFTGINGPYKFRRDGLSVREYDTLKITSRRFSHVQKAAEMIPPELPFKIDQSSFFSPHPRSNSYYDPWDN